MENLVPSLATASLVISQLDRVTISFAALPGQFLTGSQQLARLYFTLAPQSSAFVPLPIGFMEASPPPAVTGYSFLRHDGRVVAVNGEPLVESFQTNGTRTVALYGKPGTTYLLETSINHGASWQLYQFVPLSGLLQFVDASGHTNLPSIFYRAQDAVGASTLVPGSPGEFKALTKLNKRKVAAALKRQKRMHARLPWPDLLP
jgi:hypothetical protein